MNEDELRLLEDELAAARAEVERLQSNAADSEARAAHLESQLAELRDELGHEQERAQADQLEAASRIEVLESELSENAQRYRNLALELSPDVPAGLVAGGTIDEVEASLQRGRETVAKVRGQIETQAQAGRVPVGAPARTGPDIASMSAAEKIRLGLGREA